MTAEIEPTYIKQANACGHLFSFRIFHVGIGYYHQHIVLQNLIRDGKRHSVRWRQKLLSVMCPVRAKTSEKSNVGDGCLEPATFCGKTDDLKTEFFPSARNETFSLLAPVVSL